MRSPLLTESRRADADDDVAGRALDVAGAVDEAVGAELLDDGDVDRQAALAPSTTMRQASGRTPTVMLSWPSPSCLDAAGSTGTR